MATTPVRYIRIDNELWRKAKQRASRENTNPSELIRLWLIDYADEVVSIEDELKQIIARINDIRKRLKIHLTETNQ